MHLESAEPAFGSSVPFSLLLSHLSTYSKINIFLKKGNAKYNPNTLNKHIKINKYALGNNFNIKLQQKTLANSSTLC